MTVLAKKLYEVLQSLKFEYGKDLDWVIPIPGDWHMLLNYQSAIMKPYFDAGFQKKNSCHSRKSKSFINLSLLYSVRIEHSSL